MKEEIYSFVTLFLTIWSNHFLRGMVGIGEISESGFLDPVYLG